MVKSTILHCYRGMGINMDITNSPVYKFLDLDGLNEIEKSHLHTMLKSETGENIQKFAVDNRGKNYNYNAVTTDVDSNMQNHCQQYEESACESDISGTPAMMKPAMAANERCPNHSQNHKSGNQINRNNIQQHITQEQLCRQVLTPCVPLVMGTTGSDNAMCNQGTATTQVHQQNHNKTYHDSQPHTASNPSFHQVSNHCDHNNINIVSSDTINEAHNSSADRDEKVEDKGQTSSIREDSNGETCTKDEAKTEAVNLPPIPVRRTFASILRGSQPAAQPSSAPRPKSLSHVNNCEVKRQTPDVACKKASPVIIESADTKTLPMNHLETSLDDPSLHKMGEFLLHYKMEKHTVSVLPRGLFNRSNYCYINSILQALLACPPFYNLLKALPHLKYSKKSSTPLMDNMVKFVNEFQPLPEGQKLPRKNKKHRKNGANFEIKGGTAFEPFYAHTMLKYSSSAGVFAVEGRQEDAEEFLSCLLNGISDEMLELMKQGNASSRQSQPIQEVTTKHTSGDEEWKVMGSKNKGSIPHCSQFNRTPVSDIFRGQVRSTISREGHESSDNVQPFFTLQLDIAKVESVKAAIETFVKKDLVEGMICSKTKQQIEAWKQVTIDELPVVLVLHLKWFRYKHNGCSKIVKNLSYDVDLKIDDKYLSSNAEEKYTPKQKQYKLFAITYHDGKETTKGHYVSDAFHVGYNAWVRYDDSSVRRVSEKDVLNPTLPRVPYLLYYRRCDTVSVQSNNTALRRD